jgi:hypothetical protein
MSRTKLLSQDHCAVIDAVLRNDFCSFVQGIFPIVSAGDQLLLNWHIEAITEAVSKVVRGEIRRLIITVPPRSLKSICVSVALPAFALGHDPTARIICVSYSDNLARKHANDCRALMRSSKYRRLFPGTRISKDTELEIETTARGFRLATSVGGTLTGPRRQPHHHRRSDETAGFGEHAAEHLAMVWQHAAVATRQQINRRNHRCDAAIASG